MNDDQLKLKSTGSHVLLVNVSKSGLVHEISTFFCTDFDTNFTGLFFHDSNHFLTFYHCEKKKKFVRNFSIPKKFQLPKNFNSQKISIVFGRVNKSNFFHKRFFHDCKHSLKFLVILKKKNIYEIFQKKIIFRSS